MTIGNNVMKSQTAEFIGIPNLAIIYRLNCKHSSHIRTQEKEIQQRDRMTGKYPLKVNASGKY